jgi:hypothetical protein
VVDLLTPSPALFYKLQASWKPSEEKKGFEKFRQPYGPPAGNFTICIHGADLELAK